MARTMKRHDTADPITGTASDANGPVDLTVFETVTYQAKQDGSGTTPLFEGPAIVVQEETSNVADKGKWRYEQTDEDVSLSGGYKSELECVLPNGKKVHFPSAPAVTDLTINPDLDDA